MNAYEVFSKFYDHYIEDRFPLLHQKYFDLVLKLADTFKPDMKHLLDASCGTGILAKMFLNSGYDIDGSDLSKEMLACASQKGIKTYNKDICNLDLDRQYDVILCFDSFGHILGKTKLKKALSSMSRCLKHNGLLICDGGTRKKAKNILGQTYQYDSEDYRFTWLNKKKDDYITVHMEIYEKKSARSFEENFCLQGHDIEDIIEAAGATDLKICYATLEPVVKQNGSFVACLRKEVKDNITQSLGHTIKDQ